MKFTILIFSFLFYSVFAYAGPAQEMDAAIKTTQNYFEKYNSDKLVLDLSSIESSKSFSILCPYGLQCPSENYNLFLKSGVGKNYFMMVFEVKDLTDLTTNTLLSTFSYANYTIDISSQIGLKQYDVKTFWGDTLVRKDSTNGSWSFETDKLGRLKGSVTSKLTKISIKRVDEWAERNCRMQDAPTPPGCDAYIDIDKVGEVNFLIEIPAQVKDCREVPLGTPGCG